MRVKENTILWDECPICGGKECEEILAGVLRCNGCRHEFRRMVPGKIKDVYYDRKYWENDKGRQGVHTIEPDDSWRGWVNSRIRTLDQFDLLSYAYPEDISVFEFGCSEGMLLYALKERGFSVMGEDICAVADESITSLGIRIDRRAIEEIDDMDDRFDIIMSFHVVEHLRNPVEVFKNLRKMLKTGGKLLMQVPINEKEYLNADHFHFFSEESGERLMKVATDRVDVKYSNYNRDWKQGTYVGQKL